MSHKKKASRLTWITFLILTAPLPGAHAAEAQQIKTEDDRSPIQGKVLEKIDASNYTYLRLKTANGETWVAVPEIDVKLNTEVTLEKPIPMFGFQSKTLKRKFDRIYFGILREQAKEMSETTKGHWLPGSSKKSATGTSPRSLPSDHPAHPTIGEKKNGLNLAEIKIKKAEGENAVTISELFTKKVELKSKVVVIRGKIIKYSPDILGNNWLHIADGTGNLKDKNFDVTVITQDNAKLGDTVLVTGKVVLDKKLDPYFFPIAIENAQIKVN